MYGFRCTQLQRNEESTAVATEGSSNGDGGSNSDSSGASAPSKVRFPATQVVLLASETSEKLVETQATLAAEETEDVNGCLVQAEKSLEVLALLKERKRITGSRWSRQG